MATNAELLVKVPCPVSIREPHNCHLFTRGNEACFICKCGTPAGEQPHMHAGCCGTGRLYSQLSDSCPGNYNDAMCDSEYHSCLEWQDCLPDIGCPTCGTTGGNLSGLIPCVTVEKLSTIFSSWHFGSDEHQVASITLSVNLSHMTGTLPYTRLVLNHWIALAEWQRIELLAFAILTALGEPTSEESLALQPSS